jgi:hypothetical protein
MTKKITISVPDDVAERLAAGDIENVSAYITEAVRQKIVAERYRKELEDQGFKITDEGIDRWRRLLAERQTQVSPDMWIAARELLARITRGEE